MNSWAFLAELGSGLLVVAALGLCRQGFSSRSASVLRGKWAACAALVASVFLFHGVLPVSLEIRHLAPAFPALLMFVAAGLAWLGSRLPLRRLSDTRKRVLVIAVVSAIFVLQTYAIPVKSCYGYAEVAQRLLATADFRNSVFLISSDESGEGQFISEIAAREQRPGHFVLRATKFLSSSGWNREHYKCFYTTAEAVGRCLEELPVGIVVLDRSLPEQDQPLHHRLLSELVQAHSEQWELWGSYPVKLANQKQVGNVQIYRLVGHENRPVGTIRLDMKEMLGAAIEVPGTRQAP